MDEQENQRSEHGHEAGAEVVTAPAPEVDEKEDNTVLMGVLSYLGILVLVPLLTDAKNDPFVKYHIKQGLALAIVAVAFSLLLIVPVLNIILFLIMPLFWLFVVIMAVIGIVNVVNKKTKPLPVLGSLAAALKI